MGISEDAGEILRFIYSKYISKSLNGLNSKSLISETRWDKDRVKRAIDYLDRNGMIELITFLDGNSSIKKLIQKALILLSIQTSLRAHLELD